MRIDSIVELKRSLRRELMARRDRIQGRDTFSAVIRARVMGLPAFAKAQAVHCFLSIGSEVDTWPLARASLAAGKRVAVPVVAPGAAELSHSWIDALDEAAFELGALGTPRPRVDRPARPGEWPLTLVPLLGFDRAGFRLGYGKGYYDRLLAQAGGVAIGLAFAAQEVPNLPHEPHDIPLDLIVTERELIVPQAA